jgi:hypothetical protein
MKIVYLWLAAFIVSFIVERYGFRYERNQSWTS